MNAVMSKNIDKLLWLTAICSFLGALTTALLMYIPQPSAPDLESAAQLSSNGVYVFKQWTLFLHPQFNIIASFGVAQLLLRKYPLQMVVGMMFLLMWAYTEMSQQAFLIDALNQMWRPALIEAESVEQQRLYETLITGAAGISDSKYFLVLYGFGFGSLLFGTALVREPGLGKWIGWSLLFIGILSISSFLRYYLGWTSLSAPVDWIYQNIYGILQPAVRVAIGIWILMRIKSHRFESDFLRDSPDH